MTCE
ncbi:hypothetical protein YPPY103_0180, partial [Yersinia pestis PY-103]